MYWTSRKLRRVARSTSTAEILAAADAVDMALYLADVTDELTYKHKVEFTTDSRSLFNLASTTKEPTERLTKPTCPLYVVLSKMARFDRYIGVRVTTL